MAYGSFAGIVQMQVNDVRDVIGTYNDVEVIDASMLHDMAAWHCLRDYSSIPLTFG